LDDDDDDDDDDAWISDVDIFSRFISTVRDNNCLNSAGEQKKPNERRI